MYNGYAGGNAFFAQMFIFFLKNHTCKTEMF